MESATKEAPTLTLDSLLQAYIDCRQHKRNTTSAREFEQHLERNLCDLHAELLDGSYRPGRSICFAITRPKPREVWAAQFRDRIVHHLLYNHIGPRFEASFVADSCACIPGRGTLYGAQRLEAQVRSCTQNWARPAFYLKCDCANFFVSIHKPTLLQRLAARIHEPWWLALATTILMHDPRNDVEVRGKASTLRRVPAHKSLFNAPADTGLPIGNLSSQFFANVLLDGLDQYAKHQLRAPHYVRYVDDFILLHPDAQWLSAALRDITAWLPEHLGVRLNPSKTILQPVDRGHRLRRPGHQALAPHYPPPHPGQRPAAHRAHASGRGLQRRQQLPGPGAPGQPQPQGAGGRVPGAAQAWARGGGYEFEQGIQEQ